MAKIVSFLLPNLWLKSVSSIWIIGTPCPRTIVKLQKDFLFRAGSIVQITTFIDGSERYCIKLVFLMGVRGQVQEYTISDTHLVCIALPQWQKPVWIYIIHCQFYRFTWAIRHWLQRTVM